ncbi:MAG: CdaR family protein [Sporomusaceae bacterium]|nr:CdaR family protein [Sporomusaceae bacterium]
MKEMGSKNAVSKVIAIILATILWLYVMNEQNPPMETSYTSALEIRNTAASTVILDAPDAVRVKIRAPRSLIAGISAKDIKPYIDVKGLAEGRHSLQVQVGLPPSIELVDISPERTTIRVDAAVQRKVAVAVRMTGTPSLGTVVGKTEVEPGQITVQGPKSAVDSIDKIVAAIDLTGKVQDIVQEVPVVIYGRDGREVEGLAATPAKVTVKAAISQIPNKKTVDVKSVIYGDLAGGLVLHRISGVPEKVELQGDPFVLEKIEFVYTEPINVNGIDKNTKRDVKLQLKEGVTATPDTVSIELEVGPPAR